MDNLRSCASHHQCIYGVVSVVSTLCPIFYTSALAPIDFFFINAFRRMLSVFFHIKFLQNGVPTPAVFEHIGNAPRRKMHLTANLPQHFPCFPRNIAGFIELTGGKICGHFRQSHAQKFILSLRNSLSPCFLLFFFLFFIIPRIQ